jgi:hypothetical protein
MWTPTFQRILVSSIFRTTFSTMMTEVLGFTKMLLPIHQNTLCHRPDDYCNNLKSLMISKKVTVTEHEESNRVHSEYDYMPTTKLQLSILYDVCGTSGANKTEFVTNAKFSSAWNVRVLHNERNKKKILQCSGRCNNMSVIAKEKPLRKSNEGESCNLGTCCPLHQKQGRKSSTWSYPEKVEYTPYFSRICIIVIPIHPSLLSVLKFGIGLYFKPLTLTISDENN